MKKPRITKPGLTWKRTSKGAWVPYYRVTWLDGGKRRERAIKLDWQGDEAGLDDLYWQARSGRHEAQQKRAKYTWGEIVKLWQADRIVQSNLAKGTKRGYRRHMASLLDRNAEKDMRRTTRAGLRKVHAEMADKPRNADYRLQIVSLLWTYAQQKQDWPLGENPAKGLDKYGTSNPFEPWPQWMIEAAEDAPETVKTAIYLIRGTGQRPSAAIDMRRDQFQDDYMTVTDQKTDREFEVFCPPFLRDYIGSLPVRGQHILPRNLSEPLGYDAVESHFRRWRKGFGEKAKRYSMHGLRKVAIIELAEAGATDAEIQAVTGQSAEMVVYYRKDASRKTLSRNAQMRRGRNGNGT